MGELHACHGGFWPAAALPPLATVIECVRFGPANEIGRNKDCSGNSNDASAVDSSFADPRRDQLRRRSVRAMADARTEAFDDAGESSCRKRWPEPLDVLPQVEFTGARTRGSALFPASEETRT